MCVKKLKEARNVPSVVNHSQTTVNCSTTAQVGRDVVSLVLNCKNDDRRNMTKLRKSMENGDTRGAHGQAYKDKSKPTDIRSSNINAAKGKCTNANQPLVAMRFEECV